MKKIAMKSINRYIFKVDHDSKDIKKVFGSLVYYMAQTAEDDKGVFPNVAEVIAIPKNENLGVKVGDTVIVEYYIHENVIDKKEGLFYGSKEEVYARLVDGELELLGDKLLVDYIEEGGLLTSGIEVPKTRREGECKVLISNKNSSLIEENIVGVTDDYHLNFKIKEKVFQLIPEGNKTLYYYDEGGVQQPLFDYVKLEVEDLQELIQEGSILMKRSQVLKVSGKYPIGRILAFPKDIDKFNLANYPFRLDDRVFFNQVSSRLYRKENGKTIAYVKISDFVAVIDK